MARISAELDSLLDRRVASRVIVETTFGQENDAFSILDEMNMPILQQASFRNLDMSFISTYVNREIMDAIGSSPTVKNITLDRDVYAFERPYLSGPLANMMLGRLNSRRESIRGRMPPPVVGTRKLTKDGVVTTEMVKKRLGAIYANSVGIDGTGVKVAVIDTGFAPNRQLGIGDVTTFSAKASELGDQDRSGHGTWCVTTIAGRRQDVSPAGYKSKQLVVDGISPGVDMMAVRVLYTPLGMGSNSDVLKGIQMAMDNGAEVMSMSLGSDQPSEPNDPTKKIMEEVTRTTDKVFVIAAGNAGLNGPQSVGSPGDVEEALTVGSVSYFDSVMGTPKRSYYSSYGPTIDGRIKPDVSAWGGGRASKDTEPNESILSSSSGLIDNMDGSNRLASIQGTSMATPQVAAVVALWKQAWMEKNGQALNSGMIKQIIEKNGLPKTDDYGHGPIQYEWIEAEY